MKKIVLIWMLLNSFSSAAQISKISRDLINTHLVFFMHKDSIQGLYENIDGIYIVDSDTIQIDKLMRNEKYFYGNPDEHLKTYLLYNPATFQRGIFTTASFYNDRLIMINMFTNKTYYMRNFEIEMKWYCKHHASGGMNMSSDSVSNKWTYGERAVTYFVEGYGHKMAYVMEEDLIQGDGYLKICHKGVNKRIPSYCLNCNGSRTWAKVNTYIQRNVRKLNKQYHKLGYNYM